MNVAQAYIEQPYVALSKDSLVDAPPLPNSLKAQVKAITDEAGAPWETVERLIDCESKWNPSEESNKVDHGLWQINDVHGVSREKMLDPIWSTHWAMQMYKEDGDFSAWTCANCVSYIKAYHYPNLPKMADLVPNMPRVEVGAVAIFHYTKDDHVAYVSAVNDKYYEVEECNFTGGTCGTRRVSYTDKFLWGLWKPK